MNPHRPTALFLVSALSIPLHAATLAPLRAHCSIGPSEDPGKFSLRVDREECNEDRHCGSNFNNESLSRFTGISLSDLSRESAALTATLAAEPGAFTCSGTVHDGWLHGESVFTPDMAFVQRMEGMGFTGYNSEKLEAYTFIGVDSAFAKSLQQTGIHGITVDNLIALRIFSVTPDYIHSLTALGYELPSADQLIGLKVQGVNGEEVREIRSLGFQPTLDELVQIRIFKITPDFIRRMQGRGLKDLTIAKLVQIRIFKLDD
ncbi:MAG TPA: hypothetical protein VGG85_12150 [Terracidiphilus sp.]|jgi:hypothetical protein